MEERHYGLPKGQNDRFFLTEGRGLGKVDQTLVRPPEKLVSKGFNTVLYRERLRK